MWTKISECKTCGNPIYENREKPLDLPEVKRTCSCFPVVTTVTSPPNTITIPSIWPYYPSYYPYYQPTTTYPWYYITSTTTNTGANVTLPSNVGWNTSYTNASVTANTGASQFVSLDIRCQKCGALLSATSNYKCVCDA